MDDPKPKPLSSRQYEWWRKVRERGRERYIKVNGILGFGLITAALFALLPLAAGRPFNWPRTLFSFVFFPIAGKFVGEWLWKYYEWRFYYTPEDPAPIGLALAHA